MDKSTENVLGKPAIVLLGIGVMISAVLFYFMFKFADEENLIMVVLTASLIAVISFGIVKGLSTISKNKFIK
jgi:hypothetical protein